jgi:hypothetical protein
MSPNSEEVSDVLLHHMSDEEWSNYVSKKRIRDDSIDADENIDEEQEEMHPKKRPQG